MKVEEIGGALRAERAARGWSLADAAREIGALATRTGRRVGSPASLRTQLSRWENGRVMADAASLGLLADLYDRPDLAADRPEEPPAASPAARLRAALARADAVDDATLRLLRTQLAVNVELDATLGAAGTGTAVAAQIAHLDATAVHTADPRRRREVARLLAEAALLGGWQALDQDDPDVAFTRHRLAHDAARLADAPARAGEALAGCASALLAVGLAAEAEAVLAEGPPAGAGAAWVRIARAEIRMTRGERADATRLYDDAAALADVSTTDSDTATPDRANLDRITPDGTTPDDARTDDAALHCDTTPDDVDERERVRWRPGHVPPDPGPPVSRRREAALAPYDDAALEALRAGVDEPGLPARERARLRTQLVLALVARGVRAEAEDQADKARELAGAIGSHREQRLLDEVLG